MYQYASADQFDERALEVTRPGGAIAWKLDLKGPACDETECERTSGEGWTFYSIERFYEAPLLYNMSCADGKLKFSAHNNFVSRFRASFVRARAASLSHTSRFARPLAQKQNNPSEARYSVTLASDASEVASGTFDFTPHWRDTDVTVHIAGPIGLVNVTITNIWGDETSDTTICSSSPTS